MCHRPGGSIDAYAATIGRWLVTRDGFDCLVFYLSDYDFASHLLGPGAAHEALARSDRAVGALVEAAGGPDEFLDRYAVVVCADHGQTGVDRAVRLEDAFSDVDSVVVTASNRAGMVYRLEGCGEDSRALAARLDAWPGSDVALYREGREAIARKAGEELRFSRVDGRWEVDGDPAILDFPNGLERAWAALADRNAGDVIVSAAPRFEFSDLAGRNHAGGGSHGSLTAGDSEVPMLTIGLDGEPASITDVAPVVLTHFGVEPPAYASSHASLHAA